MPALLFLLIATFLSADSFESESAHLAQQLKGHLVNELTKAVTEKGAPAAVEFCQVNVKPIAKSAAGDLIQRYEFGRTSHKIRNLQNKAAEWMDSYLLKYQGTSSSDKLAKSFVHRLPDQKRVYLEPLYVQPLCLQCHGEKIAPAVEEKLSKLYPEDKATGFKLGEFRGFIWVKEK
jgi:hypothetical protein